MHIALENQFVVFIPVQSQLSCKNMHCNYLKIKLMISVVVPANSFFFFQTVRFARIYIHLLLVVNKILVMDVSILNYKIPFYFFMMPLPITLTLINVGVSKFR